MITHSIFLGLPLRLRTAYSSGRVRLGILNPPVSSRPRGLVGAAIILCPYLPSSHSSLLRRLVWHQETIRLPFPPERPVAPIFSYIAPVPYSSGRPLFSLWQTRYLPTFHFVRLQTHGLFRHERCRCGHGEGSSSTITSSPLRLSLVVFDPLIAPRIVCSPARITYAPAPIEFEQDLQWRRYQADCVGEFSRRVIGGISDTEEISFKRVMPGLGGIVPEYVITEDIVTEKIRTRRVSTFPSPRGTVTEKRLAILGDVGKRATEEV
ncbi:hypothetical protein GGS20DRAFT_209099 [Poronia punctata]|nr:hypothetical protein GGS20DRAFT_209099 [Poronia punctata]